MEENCALTFRGPPFRAGRPERALLAPNNGPFSDPRKAVQGSGRDRVGMVHLNERTPTLAHVDPLTLFGLFAVTAMLVCYALEQRSRWSILGFAIACALGSIYGFLQGAWPFGAVEAIWSLVALRRWWRARRPLVA